MSSVKVDWDRRAEENFLDGKEVFLRKYSMRNEVCKGSSEVGINFFKGNSQKGKKKWPAQRFPGRRERRWFYLAGCLVTR